MSNKLTYIEARDKIWSAYFRDEIKPYSGQFCFCGTLAGFNEHDNNTYRGWYVNQYGSLELQAMEDALLETILNIVNPTGEMFGSKFNPFPKDTSDKRLETVKHPKYEDAIFAGMLAALEVLKQIHRDRGDFIPEDEPLLTKRNLEHA